MINPAQAKDLLGHIRAVAPDLHAYFATMYYAALRPAEARNIRKRDLKLPAKGWGEIVIDGSFQFTEKRWTDSGRYGEERGLKHRAVDDWRRVPLTPALVAALREHLEEFDTDTDGRLFVTRVGPLGRPVAPPYGNPINTAAASRVLRAARQAVFTPEQVSSPLVQRQYDLRHAAVSTWLAAGVPPPLVAEWAGHSVKVLLDVYAHALEGHEEIARTRIEAALADEDPDDTPDSP